MTLAQWSNLFVYASIAMYAMAMVAFAASFASARAGSVARSPADRRVADRRDADVPDADVPDADVPAALLPAAERSDTQALSGAVTSAAGATAGAALGPDDAALHAGADSGLLARTGRQPDARRTPATSGALDTRRTPGAAAGAGGPARDDGRLPPGRRAGNIGMSLTWFAFALLLLALVTRAAWAGRAPWGNMYEFALASAAAMTGVFLVVSLRRDVRWLGLLVTMAVLITLGVAVLLLYNDSPQLVPAL